jgi:hypothetical protein
MLHDKKRTARNQVVSIMMSLLYVLHETGIALRSLTARGIICDRQRQIDAVVPPGSGV